MKLKLSEIEDLAFPEFKDLQWRKTYGNKYFKFWIESIIKNSTRLRGYCCGETFSAPYTPEGYKQLQEQLNAARREIALKLRFATKEDE